MARSFLKWAGGKTSALPQIFKHMPQHGETLIEPFMGSCSVSLNTDFKKYILADYNKDLVTLCAWVAKRPKDVIEQARVLFVKENNNRTAFEALRARYNMSRDEKERALLFLYLNRHAYNGLMRYNQSGFFNTSFGQYKSPLLPVEEMHAFSKKMKNAKFVVSPFDTLRFVSRNGVQVYADPPYLPASKTASFASYTKEGFKPEQHNQLNKKCALWQRRGASVWLSNHAVPALELHYKNASETFEFMVPRTISRNVEERKPVKEVLLRY